MLPRRLASGLPHRSAGPVSDESDAPGTLFLTGGTGLIGSHAAARWREEGHRVRALVRPDSDTRFLEELGCDLVVGDLEEPRSFRGAADGCGVGLHAAAMVAVRASWERYRAVNVEGTRHAVTECLRAGVGRFVHVSSVAVYGHPSDHRELPIDESAPTDLPLPRSAHYERSKRAAEEVVRSIAGEALEWVILRPCVVMGERDRAFTPRVARLAGRPLIPVVGGGENDLAVVYAGTVAGAAWAAAGSPAAAGSAFNVTDDGELRQRRLLSLAREELGGPGLTVPVPEPAARAAVAAIELGARIAPGGTAPPVSRRQLWFLTRGDPFDSSRLRRQLGWSPLTSTEEGWKRALAWYRRVADR